MAAERVVRKVTRTARGREAGDHGRAPDHAPGAIAEVDALFRAVVRRVAGQPVFPANLDLTMGQFRALSVLSAEQPLSIGRLAQRLGVGQPSVSWMFDRLLARPGATSTRGWG